MEKEKAIEYLNDVRNGIHIPAPGIELPLLNDKEKEAIDLAIAALEKQIPRTVRTQFDRWNNYFLHFCPVCGGLVREYEYCNECGQKLSYEEEQEEDE